MPLNGIRTHDPSVRASEDGSCLRLRSHRDRKAIPVDNRIESLKTISLLIFIFRYLNKEIILIVELKIIDNFHVVSWA
jgi:hypothetical protein